jgi:hypothetical protein
MVFMFRRSLGGILNLITQLLTAAIWIGLVVMLVRATHEGIQEDRRLGRDFSTFGFGLLVIMCLWALAGAAGTLFWFFRQFQHAAANARFTAWLKANAEKIHNNAPVFYRCKRVTLKTVLVRHHLVCSALVLTSRSSTRWLVSGQESRRRHALGASLYSFWNGWWGLPFGLIWTPIAIVKNISANSTLLVEDLLRVPPPPPVGFKRRQAEVMRETTKELLIMD